MATQRPSTTRYRTRLYEDVCALIEREYASDLQLDDVARRIASSRRQIQRAFAEIGGSGFRQHLTKVRMEQAAQLLAAPGPNVKEVARRVGYRQPAQFAKAFRRAHGVSPTEFRATSVRPNH